MMKGIAIALVLLAFMNAVAILYFAIRRVADRRRTEVEIYEPDLRLVTKPHLIGKVPENEDFIPDANAPSVSPDTRLRS